MFRNHNGAYLPLRQRQAKGQVKEGFFPKKRSSILYLGILISLLVPVCFLTFSQQAHAARAPFTNPILSVPDPFVTHYNSTYYVTGTTGNNVTI